MTSTQSGAPVALGSRVLVVHFEEIDSTSMHARREIAANRLGDAPAAFVAACQTAGVGRFGRSWSSPEGGLWMTLAWPCVETELAARLDGLGLRVGMACLRVVQSVCAGSIADRHVRLKWPNDVLVHGRKALGVLTEIVRGPEPSCRPWIVVGVGINANIELGQLPEPARSHATSLKGELGRPVELGALEQDVLRELAAALSVSGLSPELIREAAANLHGRGRDTLVSLPDGTRVSGVLTGLNDHGMAVLNIDGRVFVPPLGSVIMTDHPEKA